MIHYNHESALVNFGLGGSLYSHTGNSLHSTAEVNKIRGYMGEKERKRERERERVRERGQEEDVGIHTVRTCVLSLSSLPGSERQSKREGKREWNG